MQAEADKAVVFESSHNLYEKLASRNKSWKTFPGYEHDSEFEADRTLLDNEVVTWIAEHIRESSVSRVAQ